MLTVALRPFFCLIIFYLVATSFTMSMCFYITGKRNKAVFIENIYAVLAKQSTALQPVSRPKLTADCNLSATGPSLGLVSWALQ